MNFRLLFTHWRLVLLATTSIALSIASGWTTWDGMSHFTREPVLSLLITFGVQAIMLVTAWLIGESFANRPRSRAQRPVRSWLTRIAAVFTAVVALLLIAAVAGWFGDLRRFLVLEAFPVQRRFGLVGWDIVLAVAGAVMLAAIVASRTISQQIIGTSRVVAENVLLWIMFLACMATSVFFSFDSLFSVLFSSKDRERTAITRSISASDRITGRVRAAAEQEWASQRTALLRSAPWLDYGRTLDSLAADFASLRATMAKERQVAVDDRDRARAHNSQRLAELTVQLQQGETRRLAQERNVDEKRNALTRLRERAAALTERLAESQSSIAAKKAEAHAEELGLSTSAVAGRGARYRAIMREVRTLEVQSKAAEEQLALASATVEAARRGLETSEKALAEAAGAKARLEADIALVRRHVETGVGGGSSGADVTGAPEVIEQLAAAKLDFERHTTRESLEVLQARCTTVESWVRSGTAAAPAAGAGCNPLRVSEAATSLFRLQAAAGGLASACGTAASSGVDVAIARSRACLAAAGLPDARAAEIRNEIDSLERNRDDRAHRFVVTWNAIEDGNPLAALALALALGIDGLVFVAGLLGATAVPSHFATLPRTAGHSVRWAESIVRNALQPGISYNAELALSVIRPLQAGPGVVAAQSDSDPHWTHELDLKSLPPAIASLLRRFVNAVTVIGAARPSTGSDTGYQLRVEVVEFLTSLISPVSTRKSDVVDTVVDREMLTAVLEPAPAEHAAVIVAHLAPTNEKEGYAVELAVAGIPEAHRLMVRRVLNAIAVCNAVHAVKAVDVERPGNEPRYLLRRDVSSALEQIIAAAVASRPATGPKTVARPTALETAPRPSVPEAAPRPASPVHRAASPIPPAPETRSAVARTTVQHTVDFNEVPSVAASAGPVQSERTSTSARPVVTISGDTMKFD